MEYAKYMWIHWWKIGDEGIWGQNLYKGVVTMLASEMAVQKVCEEIMKTDKLDAESTHGNIYDVYTVHFWHTNDDFSKTRWHAGEYDNHLALNTLTQSTYIPSYILYLVQKSTHQ
ncbi:MAG: hypothetical protein EOP45_06665 [Sphingobacteriaceae bacterium]|nr:MAG: hypothetical protein EOP45_06665 [Sphingobacteriaceae bacterium]